MTSSGLLPDPRERPWLSVAELAAITGEGEKAIRAALDAGHLPVMRVGRYVRIPTHQLLQQLGMTSPDMSEAGPASPAIATAAEVSGGPRRDQHPTPRLRTA